MPKINPRTIIDIEQDPGLSRKVFSITPVVKKKIKRPLQWVKDNPDARDIIYVSSENKLATKIDLRTYCSPIEDQGILGSCTGQAIAGAIELLNNRGGKPNDVSRLFIYYFERVILGTVNYDSGAYIRSGIKATSIYGASLESLWPYIISKYNVRPDDVAIADGEKRKVVRYERILDHDGCLDALNNGYPIAIGFYVYPNFYKMGNDNIMPIPNSAIEMPLGGHAVLLVGYDIESELYIARNSWGVEWGDKGYFYMPFEIIKNRALSNDFWIIKEVNNP